MEETKSWVGDQVIPFKSFEDLYLELNAQPKPCVDQCPEVTGGFAVGFLKC